MALNVLNDIENRRRKFIPGCLAPAAASMPTYLILEHRLNFLYLGVRVLSSRQNTFIKRRRSRSDRSETQHKARKKSEKSARLKMRFRYSIFDVDVIQIPRVAASSMDQHQHLFSFTDNLSSTLQLCNSEKWSKYSFDLYKHVPHPEAE
jgi:hypothetical protein